MNDNNAPKEINLEKLYIAAPCPTSWNSMKGDNKVRYCDQCKLNVYNVSAMTKKEAEEFIATTIQKSSEITCIRMYQRKDGTLITQDCPVGLKKIARKIRLRLITFISVLLTLEIVTFFPEKMVHFFVKIQEALISDANPSYYKDGRILHEMSESDFDDEEDLSGHPWSGKHGTGKLEGE